MYTWEMIIVIIIIIRNHEKRQSVGPALDYYDHRLVCSDKTTCQLKYILYAKWRDVRCVSLSNYTDIKEILFYKIAILSST